MTRFVLVLAALMVLAGCARREQGIPLAAPDAEVAKTTSKRPTSSSTRRPASSSRPTSSATASMADNCSMLGEDDAKTLGLSYPGKTDPDPKRPGCLFGNAKYGVVILYHTRGLKPSDGEAVQFPRHSGVKMPDDPKYPDTCGYAVAVSSTYHVGVIGGGSLPQAELCAAVLEVAKAVDRRLPV